MVGDILRASGFDVVDLGSDVPVASFVEAVSESQPIAVGISVTGTAALRPAAEVARAIKASAGSVVLFGGIAVENLEHARKLGGDGFAADGAAAAAWVTDLIR